MPKRPCAVAITPDDSKILIADKFGDVYALPLLGQNHAMNSMGSNSSASKDAHQTPAWRHFVPSATALTVHTKKNRRALEQQQKLLHRRPEKESLKFDHQLIIGHVSLLTDLACISVAKGNSKPRQYILTADRDEHIRVSRGMPQAHIIEGFCLGHTQFITKLSFPQSRPELLISGGGDDFILLWDWTSSTILQKFDLREHVEGFLARHKSSTQSDVETQIENGVRDLVAHPVFAVSHIKTMDGVQGITKIFVVCEKVPAVFFLSMDEDGRLTFQDCKATTGNIVDIAVSQDMLSLVYSMDTLHHPYTATLVGNEDTAPNHSVGAFTFDVFSNAWTEKTRFEETLLPVLENCAQSQPFVWQTNAAKGKSLTELLYSLESLRKRTNENENEADDAE